MTPDGGFVIESTGERIRNQPAAAFGVMATTGMLVALNLVGGIHRMIFAVLAPAMQPALHLCDPQLGLVLGPAYPLPYAAALPFAGGWSTGGVRDACCSGRSRCGAPGWRCARSRPAPSRWWRGAR